MKIIGWILLFFLIVISVNVFAYDEKQVCDKAIVDLIAKHLKINDKFFIKTFENADKESIIIAAACKPSPLDKNIELAVLAYDLFDEKQPGKEYIKDLIVAMVDKAKRRIISSYQVEIEEDAVIEVGETSLTIDTARYQLTPTDRAIGLRFQSIARMPSCGEGWWGDELTLFVQEGEKLRPVLGLPMYAQQSLTGCLSVQDNEASWEDAKITIGVEKAQHKGYADLLLTAQIAPNSNDEKILEKLKSRFERHTLRYDGVSYKAVEKTKPWWMFDGFNTIATSKPN